MRRLQAITWVWVAAFGALLIAAPNAGAGRINIISSFTAGIVEGNGYRVGLAVEYDGQYFWTTGMYTLTKRVYPTGSIIRTFGMPQLAPYELAYDGRYLYTNDAAPYTDIYVIEPSSGTIVNSWPYPVSSFCTGLAYDGRNLYYFSYRCPCLWYITTGGSVISSYEVPINVPSGIAYDDSLPGGPYVWCCDEPYYQENKTSYIYMLTTSGSVVESTPWPIPGSNLLGLTFDGTNLWCIENVFRKHNQVYQVSYIPDIAVVPASVGRIKALYR